jgi:hypothetical protein
MTPIGDTGLSEARGDASTATSPWVTSLVRGRFACKARWIGPLASTGTPACAPASEQRRRSRAAERNPASRNCENASPSTCGRHEAR